MWLYRLRKLLSFARRGEGRPVDPAEDQPPVDPSVSLRQQSHGVTIHVGRLRASRATMRRENSPDVLDYLVGFLVVGLVALGGALWTSKNSKAPPPEYQSPSVPRWLRPGAGDTSSGPSSLPLLEMPRLRNRERTASPSENLPTPSKSPVPTHVVPASYTEEAISAKFHGKVFVIVYVDSLGVPVRIEPTAPIPFGLERTVRRAVFEWRFRPAFARGVPVASKTVVEVPFSESR